VGNRRQCRSFFNNRCPFEDKQVEEIVGTLKKVMDGEKIHLPLGSSGTTNSVPVK